jgi:hypothetical protein
VSPYEEPHDRCSGCQYVANQAGAGWRMPNE